MQRTAIAIIVAIVAIAAILAGAYKMFFVLAAHMPAGRTLGMASAALMMGSGLVCAAIGYAANRWAQRR
jgi:uncharacterized membrane protein YidH (DUF202 family)